jgi:catalase (peroxidase I)
VAWQFDLPAPNVSPDFAAVKADLRTTVASNPGAFAMLAWQCASTFRRTDYRGGCNGARIQFAPENTWPANVALNTTNWISALSTVRAKYTGLSLADTITLAGHVAVEQLAGVSMDFCAGRSDATDGAGSANLNLPNWTNKTAQFRDLANRLGLTLDELVVLQGLPRPADRPTWTSSTTAVGTANFVELIGNTASSNAYDTVIRGDTELKGIATAFSTDQAKIQAVVVTAWTKLMNNDLFIGWNNITCPKLVPKRGNYHTGEILCCVALRRLGVSSCHCWTVSLASHVL